eukprot:gene17269-8833_t
MKKGIQGFHLKVFAEESDRLFIDPKRPVKGAVRLKLIRDLTIHSLMIGWSTTYHCQELVQSKTRIGKQFYIETIHSLIGEIESSKLDSLKAGDHIFEFKIPSQAHQFEKNENVSNSTTLLSWHNLKAALVDKQGVIWYADVVICDHNKDPSNELTANIASENINLIDRSVSPGGNEKSCPVHHGGSSESWEPPISQKDMMNRNLDLQCRLFCPYYKQGEAVTFTVQCRNSSNKGYRHLCAVLVERSSADEKNQHGKSKVISSITGPSVAPKEIVIWNSQLPSPAPSEESAGRWYTLKVELKSRFSTKKTYRVPVVIMDHPLTPM